MKKELKSPKLRCFLKLMQQIFFMMANKIYCLGKLRLHQILEFEICTFWISSLIGQFKNSEKNLSWIFELTNQRRGRENSKLKSGPTLDQDIVKLGPKLGLLT